MADEEQLYPQVVKVTQEYLGPAAERFLARKIETHLKKKPEDLTQEDLAKVIEWLKVAITVLSEDSKTVDNFTENLLELARQKK